jgi:hypothetical protein
MKTKEKSTKEIATAKVIAKNDSVTLNKELTERLAKINVDTLKHSASSKKSIYKYSDELIKLNDESKFKTFRKQIRKQKYNFCADILKFAKENNKIELQKTVKLFLEFYKNNFIINDFTINDFSNTDKNKEVYTIALSIVKENFSK